MDNSNENLSSSSLMCLFNHFREDGCSHLSYFIHDANNTTNIINDTMMSQDEEGIKQQNEEIGSTTWICANDLGDVLSININNINNNNNVNKSNAANEQITAIASSPNGKQIALAFGDSLNLRKFPDVENEIILNNDDENDGLSMQMLCRRTLPITHIEYDSHGKM